MIRSTGLGIALAVALAIALLAAFPARGGDVVDRIKAEEGFAGNPYRDSLGNWTVGYGILLPLTRHEAEMLLRGRLERERHCVASHWEPWQTARPEVRDVLTDMAYQLGCAGVMKFRKMLAALAHEDWKTARIQGLDSKWARETPHRAAAVLGRLPRAD